MALDNLSILGNVTNLSDIANKTISAGNWLTNTIVNAPAEISAKLYHLITILQIAGIVIIAYVLFLIIKAFLNWRRHAKIEKTYEVVNEINKKLDILLKDHEDYKKLLIQMQKSSEKNEVKPKKKSLFQRLVNWKNSSKQKKEPTKKEESFQKDKKKS